MSTVLQIAVVQLPFMNHVFDTTPLPLGDWLTCIGLASIVLWADEIKKVVTRRVVSLPHDHDRARRVLGDMLSG